MNASVSNRPANGTHCLRPAKILLAAALAALAFGWSACHDSGANSQSTRAVASVTPESDVVPDAHLDSYGEEELYGSWKLLDLSVSKNSGRPEHMDYSKRNIIYEFHKGNKMTVNGKTDNIFVFDDFRSGKHHYEYQNQKVCPRCAPAENLVIKRPAPGPDGRYHVIMYNDRTMRIVEEQRVIGAVADKNGRMKGGDTYTWEKTFIKLK